MKRYRVGALAAVLALSAGGALAPASGARAPAHRGAAHKQARSRTFSFYAKVVKASAKGLVVRTADGKTLSFSARQIVGKRSAPTPSRHGQKHRKAHAADITITAGTVTINLLGLQPGVTILITETVDPAGNVTITITLPPPSQSGAQNASGVVNEVDSDAFQITTGDGSVLRLHMAEQDLSNLSLQSCNTVDVTYHQDAGMLIADTVKVTGSSTSGDCTPTYDATGTITDVSGTSLTVSGDNGSTTFVVDDPSVTAGFQKGDLVDVTYTQAGDGTLHTTNVQYVEQDATGKVTSVSATSVTITDDSTGQPSTFTADPNHGLQMFTHAFTGVSVGDELDVSYHQSAGQLIADTVCDEANDTSDDSSDASSGGGSGS